ncbi:unnamed protein product [Sphagnum jensenii]|uniref:Protein NLP2 n=1 Tax=Sphagnum jensenii TaxID=128206 RepID=A0ABP1BZL5_9BRYO
MDRSVNQVTATYYLRQQEEDQQQNWGTTEFIALNQQQQQQMMMMVAPAASGLSSIGEQQQLQHHPKFQVDDVVLAELMDMEIPFCSEQILLEQPWMSSSNCSPAVAAEFAFSVSGHQHHLYSNSINSNSNITTFANLQAGCLPPPANSFSSMGHPIPSAHFPVSQEESEETHGSDFTTMPPSQGNLRSTISGENFAELSQLLLGVTANNSTEGEGEEGEAAEYSAMMPGEQLQSLISLPPPPPPLVQCRSFSRNHETAGGGGILQHNSSILCYEKALDDLVTSSSSSLEMEEARSSGQVKQVSRARSRGAAAAAGRLDHHGLTIQERTMQALQYIGKACVDVLVQVWMPMKTDDNRVLLTTREQPFVLEHKTDHRLQYYRSVSEEYEFAVTSSSPGLPGRVFLQQVPEWTPNVQFYNSQEYLRVKDAQKYDVRGTLAVPVFEPSSRNCLAVIELVMSAEKLQYAPEIDIICRALQSVNLASSDGTELPALEMRTQGRQAALAEIAEVLTAVCETHKLPLAQTWIPGSVTCHAMNFIDGNDSNDSNRRFMNSYESSSSNSSSSSNNNNDNGSGGRSRLCLRTADGPHYVNDPRVWGFRHACSEHFLEKGQGLPGKAYVSNQPSFEPDVKNYSKIEYPLGHYARLFGLGAAVAIRLRSIHTGSDDYVLEFFLPPTCVNSQEQQVVLNSLSITMQRVCRSLRTVSDKELQEEKGCEFQIEENYQRNSGGSLRVSTVGTQASPDTGEKQEVEDPQISNLQSLNGAKIEESGELTEEGSLVFTSIRMGLDAATQKQRLDRRRGTSEKTIGLDIIQQYFTGSLKDAAKSIGVCPTTLKRICRQHGISRWPSRKINKVNRSLKKLQGVIESVHGADVHLHLTGAHMSISEVATFSENSGVGDDKSSDAIEAAEWANHKSDSVFIESQVHGSCGALTAVATHAECIPYCLDADQISGHAHEQSKESGSSHAPHGNECSSPSSGIGNMPSSVTVKATFEADTVRFKLAFGSSFMELKNEIALRFQFNGRDFDLKYLDDDEEWMLLTCDRDLSECIDVMQSLGGHVIKLLVAMATRT